MKTNTQMKQLKKEQMQKIKGGTDFSSLLRWWNMVVKSNDAAERLTRGWY